MNSTIASSGGPANDPAALDAGAPRPAPIVTVSVLVPVYNEAAKLARVLSLMLAQEEPGGGIEFIFIDGGSSDETRRLLEVAADGDPRIRIFDNPRRITSAGLNIGLAHASGEFVARMDAHTEYPAKYLRVGVARLRCGDAASVSGPQLAVGADDWSRRIAAALSTRLGVGGAAFRRPVSEEIEVDSGFTGIWRRETIKHYEGWNEPYYPNEDAELAARIRSDGGRILCLPEMAAEYVPRNSLSGLWGQYWRYGRARARTVRQHPNALRPGHLLPPSLVLAAVAAPRPSRHGRAARRGLGAYALAVLTTSATARCDWRDALYLPIILPTMHVSWGAGFLFDTGRLALHGGDVAADCLDRIDFAERAACVAEQVRAGV
jgi:succinoglycan biosynthesis protein ExoA